MFPLAVLLALSATPAEELNRSVGIVLREEVLTVLFEKKAIPVKLSAFTGTLSAVDANKTLKVEAREVSLKKDTATLKLNISGEWLLKGKLNLGTGASDVTLKLRAVVDAPVSAALMNVRGAFVVRPTVGDVTLVKLDVLSLVPEPFPGAKAFAPTTIKSVWKADKAKLQKLTAAKVKDFPLPQPKLVIPAGGPHDNKVLRQYVQSMIASQAIVYDGPRAGFHFDENFPYVHAVGGVWLDDPKRRLKVSIHFLTLHDGVLYWDGEVVAPLRGHCRITIPDTITGVTDFVGVGRVRFGGDLELKGGEPGGCNVYLLSATLNDFTVAAAPFRIVRRAVEKLANRFAADIGNQYARKVEKLGGGPNRARLVVAGYRRALGRAPEAKAVRDWSVFLERHTPRELLAALAQSPEFASTRLKGKDTGGMVKEVWWTFLDRPPLPLEVDRWSKWVRERVTVYEERRVKVGLLRRETRRVPVGVRTRTYKDVAVLLAECAEYRTRFGEGLPR